MDMVKQLKKYSLHYLEEIGCEIIPTGIKLDSLIWLHQTKFERNQIMII